MKKMLLNFQMRFVLLLSLCISAPCALAIAPIGAAPKGDAKAVASKIINI